MAESQHLPSRPAAGVRRPARQPLASGWLIIAFILVAGASYVGGALYGQSVRGAIGAHFAAQGDLDLSRVQQTYSALKNNFDGPLDDQKLIEGASRGLVAAAGDEYTVFMSATESTEFNDSLSGTVGGGVGIEVGMRGNLPTVLRLLENNPAQKAGVMVGDVIAKVNDDSTEKWSLNEVVAKIKGEAGTTVRLSLIRGGQLHEFSMTREIVNNPSAYGEVKDGIGILTVTRFDDATGALARRIAQDFKQQQVAGVVLDLRGNGGGYVTAAQAVAGIWLENKTVVVEKAGGKTVEELKTGRTPILQGVPTAVLMNKSSASASEIVAGALRDHKAATLVGTESFGKGSVQKMVNLAEGTLLKVTVARWFTPAGVSISETGIKPDVLVDRTADDINANKDPQLDAALRVLQR